VFSTGHIYFTSSEEVRKFIPGIYMHIYICVFGKPAEVISRCMRIPAGCLLKCGVFILGPFGMLVKGEEAAAGSALTLAICSAL